MISTVFLISIFAGYFYMIYKIIKSFKDYRRNLFIILSILGFPVAVIVGIFITIFIIMEHILFIYLELALSAKLFPCYVF